MMIGVLALIWAFFHWATGSIFLTPTNLSNLATQMSVTAIIAVGPALPPTTSPNAAAGRAQTVRNAESRTPRAGMRCQY